MAKKRKNKEIKNMNLKDQVIKSNTTSEMVELVYIRIVAFNINYLKT